MDAADAAVRQARIEKLFFNLVAELPRCVGSYVDRMNRAAIVAGFSFDVLLHRDEGELVSDKMHCILASDKVGMLMQMIMACSEEKLTRIWEIVKE